MSQKIEHNGIITHIDDKNIKVSIIQKSACSDCHAKGTCTASDMDEKIIDIANTGGSYQVGEMVKITGQTSMGFLAVLLAFVIPFTLILIGLFVLRSFTDNEAISGTISLALLIPYYIILSLFNKKLKNKFQFTIEKDQAF
ncbi:MAG: SoxR reducing system RseC family protein [Paludibacter sp.]|nr:SoxR reducing system RseC family protein [Paludibacter sp.]